MLINSRHRLACLNKGQRFSSNAGYHDATDHATTLDEPPTLADVITRCESQFLSDAFRKVDRQTGTDNLSQSSRRCVLHVEAELQSVGASNERQLLTSHKPGALNPLSTGIQKTASIMALKNTPLLSRSKASTSRSSERRKIKLHKRLELGRQSNDGVSAVSPLNKSH